jgi:CRISPR-associated protein Csb2
MSTFRLSIRLLDGAYHGRGDGGEPEWPPSPLRAFQALVNAAARYWREPQFDSYPRPALEWLEGLGPPVIVAPPGRTATRPYRLYVPNNAGDLMAAAWARGDSDSSMAGHRTEKDVRPTRFAGPDGRPLGSNPDFLPVHFDWPLTAGQYATGEAHRGTLEAAARSITHLGWGVDQAVGNAHLLADDPPADPAAERWLPTQTGSGTPLRVPRAGTLDELRRKHQAFLGRLRHGSFDPVPPLSAFAVVGYRRATDPAARPWAAFRILALDPDAKPPSFDTPRRARDVAAWVRHATAGVCDGWRFENETPVRSFVHGHAPDDDTKQFKGAGANARFQYLPLPSVERRGDRGEHVGSIRRVLVAAPAGFEERVKWVRLRLPGNELIDLAGQARGVLERLTDSDWVLGQYTRSSAVWSTVTPVVWPRHDDHDPAAAERILREAFAEAGVPGELAAAAGLEWRNVGFRAGVEPASRYVRPDKLSGRTSHVRVTFPREVPGPLAVGAGRYRGFGLFAAG